LRGTVTGYAGSTPYVRWGNVPVLVICWASLGLVLLQQMIRGKELKPRR